MESTETTTNTTSVSNSDNQIDKITEENNKNKDLDKKALEKPKQNFDEIFQEYVHRLFRWQCRDQKQLDEYVAKKIDYFGILSIVDPNLPKRKLWYLYYCKSENLKETVEKLFEKYGKNRTQEIYREHTISGVELCMHIKKNLTERKFYTKGNIIEAPRDGNTYSNEVILKVAIEAYNCQRQKLFNYFASKHEFIAQYHNKFD